jgi:ABC-type nitrate/sulfonate/bicarbonate transport system permease component
MSGRAIGGQLLRRVLVVLALPAVLFAIWWFTSASSTSFYFPSLHSILATIGPTWFGDRLTQDVLPSIGRLVLGYLLAAVLGVALGTATGSSRPLRAFLEPVLEFLRAIPPPVLVPVLMLFAGIGSTMKVAVIASGCIWPVLLNTAEGVRAIDPVQTDTCHSYRVTGWTKLSRVTLPAAGPQIFAGLRQALSIGIILMVISEMFAANSGLGYTIVQFQRSFAIPEMWGGIIVLGVLGFLLALIFGRIERRVLRWYYGLRQVQRES